MVDYLQIVGGISATNASERSTVIADIATTLKDFSKEYNCPVIALAQLNRDAPDDRKCRILLKVRV